MSWNRGAQDPWSASDPWGGSGSAAAAAASGSQDDCSGSYVDPWGKSSDPVVEVTKTATGVSIKDPTGHYPQEEGTLSGTRIEFWGLKGSLKTEGNDLHIDWDNGSRWTRVQGTAPAASASGGWWDNNAAQPATPSPDGSYMDIWKGEKVAELVFNGTSVTVKDTTGKWPEETGTLEGDRISFWGIQGTFDATKFEITFDNGCKWARQQDETTNGWGAPAGWGGAAAAAPAWDEREELEKKKQMRWRDFEGYQKWYIQDNILPGKTEEELQGDDVRLFLSRDNAHDREGIDFSLYDLVTSHITGPRSENLSPLGSFEELSATDMAEHMPQELFNNIQRCGYTKPTPVQKFAIPAALLGRDVMICAQTGSGKTAAFLIPVMARMMKGLDGQGVCSLQTPFQGPCSPDTLVMSPTRELCLQIYEEAARFCHRSPFRCVRVYGQEMVKTQLAEIAKGADLMVATPGRLYDFVQTGVVKVDNVHLLVLDEADRMIEMNQDSLFREVIEEFGMRDKNERQTLMVSATFPDEIQKMAVKYLYEHLYIAVGTVGTPAVTVTQKFVKVDKRDKLDMLMEVVNHWLDSRDQDERMLIFTNSKTTAKGLNEQMWEKSIDVGALHGDLEQKEREENLAKLRDGRVDVLVATDVASRGLDIRRVRHIINYDLPNEISVYVQRIGRTGRIGHRGNATTFISVDRDTGDFLDRPEVLKALPDTLKENQAAYDNLPDWLMEKAQELQKGDSWQGNQWWEPSGDARTADEGNVQWQTTEENVPWRSWEEVSAASAAAAAAAPEKENWQ